MSILSAWSGRMVNRRIAAARLAHVIPARRWARAFRVAARTCGASPDPVEVVLDRPMGSVQVQQPGRPGVRSVGAGARRRIGGSARSGTPGRPRASRTGTWTGPGWPSGSGSRPARAPPTWSCGYSARTPRPSAGRGGKATDSWNMAAMSKCKVGWLSWTVIPGGRDPRPNTQSSPTCQDHHTKRPWQRIPGSGPNASTCVNLNADKGNTGHSGFPSPAWV